MSSSLSELKGSSYTQEGECYLLKNWLREKNQEGILGRNHSVIFGTV
jgi:hypothetical protein